VLPGFQANDFFAYLGAGEAFLVTRFSPENLDVQTEILKVLEFPFAPLVIDGQKEGAVHRDIMAVKLREVDRKGDNGEFGDPQFSLQKSRLNHQVTFEIGERVGREKTALRVCGVISREDRVRVGDADDHVTASGFACQEVFQMVIVEDLESSVDNTGFYHWIPPGPCGSIKCPLQKSGVFSVLRRRENLNRGMKRCQGFFNE